MILKYQNYLGNTLDNLKNSAKWLFGDRCHFFQRETTIKEGETCRTFEYVKTLSSSYFC